MPKEGNSPGGSKPTPCRASWKIPPFFVQSLRTWNGWRMNNYWQVEMWTLRRLTSYAFRMFFFFWVGGEVKNQFEAWVGLTYDEHPNGTSRPKLTFLKHGSPWIPMDEMSIIPSNRSTEKPAAISAIQSNIQRNHRFRGGIQHDVSKIFRTQVLFIENGCSCCSIIR